MKELRDHAANGVRRRLLSIWESHGGGFYGFVAALTFLYLEVIDIAGDLAALPGTGLGIGSLVSFMIGNMVDAFVNAVRAALWPVAWIDHFGVGLLSGAMLTGSYVVFRAIQPSVQRLLEPTDAVPAAVISAGSEVTRS